MGPLIAALVPMIPGVLKSVGDLLKKPNPKAEFDSAIKEAQRKAQTQEQKAAVESARLQGLKYLREWYAAQDPNNPPPTVAKWGQSGIDAYRRNIEQAKAEMNGVTNAFSTGTDANTQYNFGYTGGSDGQKGSTTADGFFGDLMQGPKKWGVGQWAAVAAALFFFTPLKKLFK